MAVNLAGHNVALKGARVVANASVVAGALVVADVRVVAGAPVVAGALLVSVTRFGEGLLVVVSAATELCAVSLSIDDVAAIVVIAFNKIDCGVEIAVVSVPVVVIIDLDVVVAEAPVTSACDVPFGLTDSKRVFVV